MKEDGGWRAWAALLVAVIFFLCLLRSVDAHSEKSERERELSTLEVSEKVSERLEEKGEHEEGHAVVPFQNGGRKLLSVDEEETLHLLRQ